MIAHQTPISSLPDAGSDALAEVVVRRLRGGSQYRSSGLLKTILLGIPTFGLLPLVAWPMRLREHVAEESEALRELAQWARHRGREPAAIGPLVAAAEGTVPSPVPMVMCLVLAALVAGVYVIQFANVPFSLDRLLAWTYSCDARFSGASPLSRQEFVYRVWVIALSVGYCLQWLQVRSHTAELRRFVERFNPIVEAERLPPVRMPSSEFVYFRPLWILAAIVLSMYGAWWGIPMVLAGMAQRRYTCVTGRRVRAELAKRVSDSVMLWHSPIATARSIAVRCDDVRCQAPIRPGARFCARCGMRVSESAKL